VLPQQTRDGMALMQCRGCC